MDSRIPTDQAHSFRFLSVMSNMEYDLMSKRKGNPLGKAFDNKVDPAFDPITAALRQMHDSVASEPIPDDFMRLMDEIDARASSGKKPS